MLNNSGYLTIKHTHHALYKSQGNATATDDKNGVTFPDFKKVALAFDYDYKLVDDKSSFEDLLDSLSSIKSSIFVEIKMPKYQELIPKMAVQINEKGEMFTPSLEFMYPFLPNDVVDQEMKLAKEIK
jgi:acetolactate synthase-1/2/3 large subunit